MHPAAQFKSRPAASDIQGYIQCTRSKTPSFLARREKIYIVTGNPIFELSLNTLAKCHCIDFYTGSKRWLRVLNTLFSSLGSRGFARKLLLYGYILFAIIYFSIILSC